MNILSTAARALACPAPWRPSGAIVLLTSMLWAVPALAQFTVTPAGELGVYFDLDAEDSLWPEPPAGAAASGTQFRLYVLATFRDTAAPAGQKLWGWEGQLRFAPNLIVLKREFPGTNFAPANGDDYCVGLGNTPLDPSRGDPLLLATYDCMLLGSGVISAVVELGPTTTCGSDASGPQWLTYPGNEIVPFAETSLAVVNPELDSWGSVKRAYQRD